MKSIIELPASMDLQLFADAGTLVNYTGGTVNAYTGATSTSTAMDPTMKTFYDTELLENARVEMYYAQFAKKQNLPQGRGRKVEWRKWNTFDRASKLEEGVIPTGQTFGMTYITGSIDQYGTYAAVTDVLELHAYDDVILGATEEMGASAAETQEALIRDALFVGTNVLYCDAINTNSNNAYVSTPTAQSGLTDAAAAFCLLTPTMVNKAVTKMKKDRVKTINGKYVAVIHPSVSYDLRQSEEWIEAHKYAATTQIFNGEIGELHGVRFIENTFAPVLVNGPLNGSTARYLTTASTFSASTGATATAGSIGSYKVTLSETPSVDLVGRIVNVEDKTTAGTMKGTLEVVGVDTTNKYLFFDKTLTIVSGDYLLPGEGGKETKAGGVQVAAYATYFFGADAFGIIDPAGGALQMIIKSKEETGGPLEQFSTVGYKFETNGADILYPERVLRVMSTSTYSGTDETNVYV